MAIRRNEGNEGERSHMAIYEYLAASCEPISRRSDPCSVHGMLTDPFGTNQITHAIVGCAIRVHTVVGPGVFENIYSECLQQELIDAGLSFEVNRMAPVVYKGVRLKSKYYLDLLVEGLVPVELKSIEMLLAIHKKQLLSQLRLLNLPVGLLINFNVEHLVEGVRRVINSEYKPEAVAKVPSAGPEASTPPLRDQQN